MSNFPADYHLCDDVECEEEQCVAHRGFMAIHCSNGDWLAANYVPVDTSGWLGVDTWDPSAPRTSLFLEDGTLLPF